MDPVTALGLATNVLTVVGAAVKIATQVKEICDSATGETRDNTTLSNNIVEYEKLFAQLRQETQPTLISSCEDTELKDLVDKCRDRMQKLQNVLAKVKAKRRRDALWKLFQSYLHKDEIERLKADLEFSSQCLDSWRLAAIHAREVKSGAVIDKVPSRFDGLDSKLDVIHGDFLALNEVKQKSPSAPALTEQDCAAVRDSLFYPEIMRRQESIDPAHEETFKWIFEAPDKGHKPWDDFSKWLEDGEGIYWINGKPGAGKSTLMSFVTHHDETRRLLATWAGDRQLSIIQYFFWYAGSDLEKTQCGLYRSLLYQMLDANPALAAYIFDRRTVNEINCIDSQIGRNAYWTLTKLGAAFSRIRHDPSSGAKFCIFIDGLDEIEGSAAALTSQIQGLNNIANIKTCVASRPWLQFSTAFASSPSLRVQDLTREDIKLYVDSRLQSACGSTEAHANEATTVFETPLALSVADKANGVFIWVKLVVTMLLEALSNGDGAVELEKVVESLPEELDELYDRMARAIKPRYKLEVQRVFLMMQCSLAYRNEQYDVFMAIVVRSPELNESLTGLLHPSRYINDNMSLPSLQRRLIAICGGFIEEVNYEDSKYMKVGFVHKSATDWLCKTSSLPVRPSNANIVEYEVSRVLANYYWYRRGEFHSPVNFKIPVWLYKSYDLWADLLDPEPNHTMPLFCIQLSLGLATKTSCDALKEAWLEDFTLNRIECCTNFCRSLLLELPLEDVMGFKMTPKMFNTLVQHLIWELAAIAFDHPKCLYMVLEVLRRIPKLSTQHHSYMLQSFPWMRPWPRDEDPRGDLCLHCIQAGADLNLLLEYRTWSSVPTFQSVHRGYSAWTKILEAIESYAPIEENDEVALDELRRLLDILKRMVVSGAQVNQLLEYHLDLSNIPGVQDPSLWKEIRVPMLSSITRQTSALHMVKTLPQALRDEKDVQDLIIELRSREAMTVHTIQAATSDGQESIELSTDDCMAICRLCIDATVDAPGRRSLFERVDDDYVDTHVTLGALGPYTGPVWMFARQYSYEKCGVRQIEQILDS